ncbi:FtsX-like permease family protein [Aquabacterium sp.]|uniref:FtsX-like permease family protein n=1 Tax=Aquabacterium sp. TaxID=1872578 RepID=UPI002CA05146|nr:FtsX-like permease family protein [Aquabacterium sp.]HSW08667.1 FtsX-like permease family protein [Aquabacterium sp.]
MWRHLLPLTLAEWRHHPWRHAVALLAVALGVALASSVQLINHSALAEFSQAVRAANGEPDVTLAATQREGFDDALFATLARDEQVAVASPVLEIDSHARRGDAEPRVALRITGIDALRVAAIAPALLPQSPPGSGPTALIEPDSVWLNPAAQARLQVEPGQTLWLQSAQGWQALRVAGRVATGGAPLAVLDIASAQAHFGRAGRLSRIDVRLVTGVDREAWLRRLVLSPDVRVSQADEAAQRISNLSLAYRVNLGVLALVALLVGGFLVYSVLALSVAQRTPAFALLGVLGLPARERRALVLVETAVLGLVGSALGLVLGAAMAWAALRVLGGDLGGGYFPGVAPVLRWPWGLLAACGLLGMFAAVAGAWWPARAAERLAPALALKGLGSGSSASPPAWPGLAALAGGGLLALLPPIGGLPLAAYGAVALLLAGGVALVPAAVQALLQTAGTPRGALPLLALRRAHHARQTASATVAGVVASLALSVALTVMVASFRDAVASWLDSVLPADLYVRSSLSSGASDQAVLPQGFAASAAALPGIARVQATRQRPLQFDARQPAVALVARPLSDPAAMLPLLGPLLPARPGELSVYISEPAAALYHWKPGDMIELPLLPNSQKARVRGIWRDYARQFGSIAIDAADYQRLSGDTAQNDLALWLAPGAAPADVATALKQLAGDATPIETIGTSELRRLSLAIFDRSFAVTRYLQAVAITVGLIGVAASLSAQVLSRRKEFGLLAHLGLTRRQVMGLVTLETLAWLGAGCAVGLALGLAIAAVLVFVVNPQSFHWTMPLQLPGWPLALLTLAVLVAGAATAAFSARQAASRHAVLAVKEDW